ncbi:MAG: 50S ribosomal protein L28 [Chloroflexi bacterium]|nr:50S ribosomal protein L28 [Chloroflexota bacterium]MBT7080439.1 50S ribosomal protein L28 [Chloroflexota bacterium]MBT7290217.1 50S ribosomal protein L28 [Chloroflexota bacterium]
MKCDICGKSPQFGHNVSHSNRHTNRKWKPNIQAATLEVEGKKQRVHICTRCMRTQNKAKN